MKAKTKIILLGILAALIPALTYLTMTFIQKNSLSAKLETQIDAQIKNSISAIAKDMYNLCKSQQESIQASLIANLNVADDIIKKSGGVSLSESTLSWQAVNQYTKQPTKVELPSMSIGGREFGQVDNPGKSSLLVDETAALVGGTCTVFQRMNKKGDMLRIATNVIKKDGRRAVGTYIPATNPDGKANPVIQTVLSGETFKGKAFVVDSWYITAYAPLKDNNAQLVGMLYVGIKQENTTSLRNAILSTKIGKEGFVSVLGGTGKTRGEYIVKPSSITATSALGEKDIDGTNYKQQIIDKAVTLQPGEIAFFKNKIKTSDGIRTQLTCAAYFRDWDWIILASAQEEDIGVAKIQANKALNNLIFYTILFGLIALVISVALSVMLGASITNPIHRIMENLFAGAEQAASASTEVSTSSQSLSQGTTEQAASLEETSSSLDEMNSMTNQNADNSQQASALAKDAKKAAETGGQSMTEMKTAVDEINASSEKISKIIKTIEEIAFQTNLLALNAAVEAARAGEHGKGFAVVAEEVRNLAKRSADAAKDTTALISESIEKAHNGKTIVDKASEALEEIKLHTTKVADIIIEIAQASREQAQGFGQISNAISQIDQVTQQTASTAEETASAAEELTAQSQMLKDNVFQLQRIIDGSAAQQNMGYSNYPPAPTMPARRTTAVSPRHSGHMLMGPDQI